MMNPNPDITTEAFKELLGIRKTNDVEAFLSKLEIDHSFKEPSGKTYRWRPVSDSLSNRANIDTASNSISSIIERLTNAFDAIIELKSKTQQVTTVFPESPRQAIKVWFNVPEGDTAKLGASLYKNKKDDERKKMSSDCKLEFYESDIKQSPTIVIKDVGIGQHPSQFSSTLLKLGDSNKISFPHLHGTYGHGGSSSFRWCEYTVIVSRRHKDTLNGLTDLVGWTIVRKFNDFEIWSEKEQRVVSIKQPPVYEYLVHSDGSVPSIVFPEFEFGTQITHIQYEAKNWYNLSIGNGYKYLRNYLFDPVLPYRLEDKRTNDFNRNMFGARSSLLESEDVAYENEVNELFSDGGTLKIRYFILYRADSPSDRPLKNYLDRENSRNTIIITLNGQRHGAFEKSLIGKELRLPNLSECLLVQVDIDRLSRYMKSKLFTSNRETIISEGDEIEHIKQRLADALDSDEVLREWEKKLTAQMIKSSDNESKKQVESILNKLLKVGAIQGINGANVTAKTVSIGNSQKYIPQDPPTILRFLTSKDPIEVTRGTSKKYLLEMNAPDNFFNRRNNRGKITIQTGSSYVKSAAIIEDFENGRLPLSIYVKDEAIANLTYKIKIIIECDNLKIPLEIERDLEITNPPVFTPSEPPTFFKILRNEPIKLIAGKANSISVATDAADDIFERDELSADFKISFNHNSISFVRHSQPRSGRMRFSIFVDADASIGAELNIVLEVRLNDGTILKDTKNAVICEEDISSNLYGGKSSVTLPNYKLVEVFRDDWAKHQWNEKNIGKYNMNKDDDGRDILYLYVNLDNSDIEQERNRKIAEGKKAVADSLVQKYFAFIAYHLYLSFQQEELLKDQPSETNDDPPIQELSDELKDQEYQRVSKTILLSLKNILSNIEED